MPLPFASDPAPAETLSPLKRRALADDTVTSFRSLPRPSAEETIDDATKWNSWRKTASSLERPPSRSTDRLEHLTNVTRSKHVDDIGKSIKSKLAAVNDPNWEKRVESALVHIRKTLQETDNDPDLYQTCLWQSSQMAWTHSPRYKSQYDVREVLIYPMPSKCSPLCSALGMSL